MKNLRSPLQYPGVLWNSLRNTGLILSFNKGNWDLESANGKVVLGNRKLDQRNVYFLKLVFQALLLFSGYNLIHTGFIQIFKNIKSTQKEIKNPWSSCWTINHYTTFKTLDYVELLTKLGSGCIYRLASAFFPPLNVLSCDSVLSGSVAFQWLHNICSTDIP